MAITNGFARTGLGFVYNSLGINPNVQRQSQESWQINPINDSVKLTLMRCVYQRAVAGCFGVCESADCPNCQALFDTCYGPFIGPTVTEIDPLSGPKGGGQKVTIVGTHLRDA